MFYYLLGISRHHKLFTRSDKIALWGSCFSEELRGHLYEELYEVEGSPYGIMYNPMSIARGLRSVLQNTLPSPEDLFFHLGEWHSLMHHGDFSNADKGAALQGMVQAFQRSRDGLKDCSLLVITFGTSYVYEELNSGQVVNNCHKLPTESHFKSRRLSIDEIVQEWKDVIRELKRYNPQLEVLFSISPIAHYRDGAHENRLSKAVLHLAVDTLCHELEGVYYFPAYEILQDELRDYRFYKSDFSHPSEEAVSYILHRFSSAFLDVDFENSFSREWHTVLSFIRHIPQTTNKSDIQQHYLQCMDKLKSIKNRISHPFLEEQSELLNLKLIELSK